MTARPTGVPLTADNVADAVECRDDDAVCVQSRHWREQAKAAEAEVLHARWQRDEVEKLLAASRAEACAWKTDALTLRAEVARLSADSRDGHECPFCGEHCAELPAVPSGSGLRFVAAQCPACGAQGPASDTPENAAGAWRKRSAAVAPPTREEVERAVDALLEARRRAVEATPRTVHGAFDALSAARAALVALATRGRG